MEAMAMYKNWLRILAILLIILLVTPALMGMAAIRDRYIVIFEKGLTLQMKDEILATHGGEKLRELGLINAAAVMLPIRRVNELSKTPGVALIEIDNVATIQAKPAPPAPKPEQMDWGVDKIEADLSWSLSKGNCIKVAVIDTGIDLTHPDLKDNIAGGVSFVSYTTSPNDDNGHGTHVAGIIGAADNDIGVIGVGPEIDLFAVKVLNRKGSGYFSDIIAGIDWCTTNGIQVINMSLGASSGSTALHDAVINAKTAGIVIVAAAGNSGGSVIYPAAYDEVIAVGATDKNDVIATFSSRGSQLDLVAPGVSIYSTYKGGSYATLSGTSMASPHVAGAAALLIGKGVGPGVVQGTLQNTAKDLGVTGLDNIFGNGLINVFTALGGTY
jgi:subtilisin family serine protease